ncbi:hypothetical protein Cfor_04610 [Coptotermes formosanus]|uniref:Uncharacterized protein n=1 Tax=Coptotermes formosanus TaxID=36987 RepID=A0A6L2PF05_COPFO|nr:hypothetical protein Cfor_04610 [Coptotermes formosanus]
MNCRDLFGGSVCASALKKTETSSRGCHVNPSSRCHGGGRRGMLGASPRGGIPFGQNSCAGVERAEVLAVPEGPVGVGREAAVSGGAAQVNVNEIY